jgi:NAD(P)-dependent dehydrogenase (short-subunit alcohol dehydrogenase family)
LLTARDRAALEATAQSIRSLGRRAEIHVADLRGDGEPARLASLAKDRFGRLDILVNNAGANRRGDFFALTDADWAAGFDLKFFAQVRLCRAAWPLLKEAGGSIVAIAGIGGRAPVADYMIGSSVIGAQLAFMKALADLGKRDGVQVNSINPGSVDTAFSIQSISKVFTLTLALGKVGDKLWQRVGREPSGSPFNSIVQLEYERGKPRNPFINAGAIAVTDVILSGHQPREALGEILRFMRFSPTIRRSRSTRRSRRRSSAPDSATSRSPTT